MRNRDREVMGKPYRKSRISIVSYALDFFFLL